MQRPNANGFGTLARSPPPFPTSPNPSMETQPCPVASVLGDEDLLAEILLRLDSPAWLVRAALVSTRWLRRASDPAVLRRFRARHPPRILALRLGQAAIGVPQPRELASAACCALLTLSRSNVLDCCNGRLLVQIDDDTDPATLPTYAVRSLLRPMRDRPLPSPLHSRSGDLLRSAPGRCQGRLLRLLDNDEDDTCCVCFDLVYNSILFCAEFSILRSGAWGDQHCPVTELPQDILDTIRAQKLLVGNKFYMMTTLGYILGLDLATAYFFSVQLPDEVRNSRTLKFSHRQPSGLCLIDALGFQLCVWHCDDAGQWVLVDTISVREACGHLNVQKWEPDDKQAAPVRVVLAGDNAEFVVFDIVASEIVCCMQLGNRVVEKVALGLLHNTSVRPLTMVWPPVFPVLEKAIHQ